MASFLPSEIARLVLGYLEEQDCDSVCEEFLNKSSNLVECLKMKQQGKEFRTELLGLNLVEILSEYSAIYSLVQQQLQKIDPDAAASLKKSGSLLDQVKFLLNTSSSKQTMLLSITVPNAKSPQRAGISHGKRRLKPASVDRKKNLIKQGHAQDYGTVSCPEISETEINHLKPDATSLTSLPGSKSLSRSITSVINAEDTTTAKTPKRKYVSHAKRTPDDPGSIEGSEGNLTMISRALLDNHKLHEKIAENINKVICTPESSSKIKKSTIENTGNKHCHTKSDIINNLGVSNSFSLELDNAIKQIVQDTESDPVFENFLCDIIGPVSEETSDDYDDRSTNGNSKMNQLQKRTAKDLPSRQQTKSINMAAPTEIDNQNAAAIESIILMNSLEKLTPVTCEMKDDNTAKNKLAQYDTIISATTEISPVTTLVTTTATMSTETTVTSKYTGTKSCTIDTNPIIGLTRAVVPPVSNIEPSSSNNMLLPQGNVAKIQNAVVFSKGTIVPPQPTFVLAEPFTSVYPRPAIGDKRLFIWNNNIAPISRQIMIQPTAFQMPQHTVVSEHDILSMPTVIVCDDRQSSTYVVPSHTTLCDPVQNAINKPQNKTIKPKIVPAVKAKQIGTGKHSNNPVLKGNEEVPALKYKITVEPLGTAIKPVQVPSEISESLPMISTSLDKTKATEKPQEVQTKLLSTPRNTRSHIRALDFSTPPKDGSSGRKLSSSPKQHRFSKTPKIAKIRTNLFISPEEKFASVPIATRSPMVKLSGDWDRVQGAELIFRGNKSSSDTSAEKKVIRKVPISRPRRAVISKFQRKAVSPERPEEKPQKVLKKNKSCWDTDLRVMVQPTSPEKKRVSTKKSPVKPKRKYIRRAKVNPALNKTEDDGATIEKQLAAMEGTDINIDPKAPVDDEKKKTSKTKKTNAVKSTRTTNFKDSDMSTPKAKEEKQNVTNVEHNNYVKQDLKNMTSQINTKCDIDINYSEETIVKPPITAKSMTILSPSKMNANKRTLEMIETTKELIVVTQSESIYATRTTITTAEIVTDTKNVSDVQKVTSKHTMSVNRNLIPMLETPGKTDPFLLPVTPKFCTPFSESPFLKMYKENFGSVDLSSIPTPNIPVTPNISLTPFVQDGSSFETRPTDYSNSSSYYQPSDNEQNQKLENALIEECIKIEAKRLNENQAKKAAEHKDLTTTDNADVPTINYVLHEIDLSQDKQESTYGNNKNVYNEIVPVKAKHPAELNISTSSNDTSNSSTSSDGSSDSDFDSVSNSSDSDSDTNITVIQAPKLDNAEKKSCRYSLRKKKMPTYKAQLQTRNIESDTRPEKLVQPKKGRSADTKLTKPVERNKTKTVSKVKRIHNNLLTELKTKLNRTIKGINSDSKVDTKKTKSKPTQILRPGTKNVRRQNKSSSNKAILKIADKSTLPCVVEPVHLPNKQEVEATKQENNIAFKQIPTEMEVIYGRDMDEEEIPRLHISSDEEHIVNIKLPTIPESSNILLKELKERGIHLIPKQTLEIKPNKLSSHKEEGEVQNLNMEKPKQEPQNKTAVVPLCKKIKIHSDLYLDKCKKIDITKLTCKPIKIDTIIGPSFKKRDEKNRTPASAQGLQNSQKIVANIPVSNNEQKINIEDNINNENSTESTIPTKSLPTNNVDFDIKIITENSPEYFNIEYDYKNPTKKKLSDYNLSLLRKEITAKVFLEEENIEQEKILTVTPLFNLLTIFSVRKKLITSRKSENKPDMKKQTVKPLSILYTDLVGESSSADEFYENKNPDEDTKTDTVIESSTLIEQHLKQSKAPEENEPPTICLSETQSQLQSSEAATTKRKRVISLEQYKRKHGKKEEVVSQENKNEDVDCEDFLMTYAIVGHKRHAIEEPQSEASPAKKRKNSCDIEYLKQNNEKKKKATNPKALLLKYGLDTLLTKVHGPPNEN